MKPLAILSVTAFSLLTLHAARAQQKSTVTLLPPPPNIKIDGSLTDWGDSLRYYNPEKQLNYALANDRENLYMAIKIKDHAGQMRVIAAGLTLSVNTKGKKKEMYSITFPVGDAGSMPVMADKPGTDQATPDDRDDMMRARLSKLRNIRVMGFPDIEGESITTANTYGIQAALNYDDNGYLIYEAAIPLKFFHADAPDKTGWAFNIKINGISKPGGRGNTDGEGPGGEHGGMGGGRGMGGGGMGGGGRGGMGGGRGGMRGASMGQNAIQGSADRSEMSRSVDFWEKFYVGSKP